jgi:hypothetical protein
MKTKTLLALAAAVSMSLSGAAFAQEFVGKNGQALDGNGAGGQYQNRLVPDGYPNADVTNLLINRGHDSLRRNDYACDVGLITVKCPAPPSRERMNTIFNQ